MSISNSIVPSAQSKLSSLVQEHSGQDPMRCYQCGKCTAGCPVAQEMDMGPRQVIRSVQLGLKDQVLSSNSIWVCLQCQTCSARCPMQIDIARVMEVLRLLAIAEAYPAAEKDIDLFNKMFLEVVKRHGRAHELELGALFNIRSGHLAANAGSLPHMLYHGKLNIVPSNIKNVREFRTIMKRAEEKVKRSPEGRK